LILERTSPREEEDGKERLKDLLQQGQISDRPILLSSVRD
jgi:hypothetical protein